MGGYAEELSASLLEDEFMLDVYLTVAVTVLFVVCSATCSLVGMDRETQVKKRAWIITTFASGLCFLLSVYGCHTQPISWDFRLRPALLAETGLSRTVVRFFRVQAALDLVLGVIFYRTQLYFLTSVVHHIAYFLLCNWMLANNCSLLFLICCLEELPTFIMALGRLDTSWRMDVPFGVTYGVLRVALHSFLCYTVLVIIPVTHPHFPAPRHSAPGTQVCPICIPSVRRRTDAAVHCVIVSLHLHLNDTTLPCRFFACRVSMKRG